MSNHQDLFTAAARARNTDPGTSHKAAASVKNITETQARILNLLKIYGPMTDEEILSRLEDKLSPSGARSRRSELVAAGSVTDSGKKKLTRSGRHTIVWAAKD